MPKEDPLDEALYELKGIINMLQANLFKMVNTREVMQTGELIAEIEKAVSEFEKKALAEFERLGVTREQEEMISEGVVPKNVLGEYKEALEIAMDLKKKIQEMREIAHKEQGLFEEGEKEQDTQKKKKTDKHISKQQHKKKFKRLGGDNWKPL